MPCGVLTREERVGRCAWENTKQRSRKSIARITRILPSGLSFAHRMRITRMPCGVIVEYR